MAAIVNRNSSFSTNRARISTPPVALLTTLGLALLALAGVWELFRGGAHVPHLAAVFLAVFCLALVVMVAEFLTQRALVAEARTSHERLRCALMAGKSVAWDLDLKTGRNGWFGDLNTMFGIPSDMTTVTLGDFYQYVHSEDRKRVAEAVAKARDHHVAYEAEFRIVHKDGTLRWVSASGEFQYTNRGEPVRMLGIAVDITDRKSVHDALLKSEEKFAKAFRASPVVLTLTSTRDHRYLDINDTFEKITGWKREEIIGRTPFDLRIWVDPAQREVFAKTTLANTSIRDYEVQYRCKDGRQAVGLGSAEMIEIQGEKCLLSAIIDITDRKKAEEDLHRKDTELAEAERLAHLGSWQWDPETLKLTWSEELSRLHGFDPNLPPPEYDQFPNLFTPESWGRLRQAMKDCVETGNVPEVDLELVQPNGNKRWVSTRGYAVRDSQGKILFLRGTSQDITERRRAEQALRDSEEKFRRVVEHIGDAVLADDAAGNIVFANDRFFELFGFGREQLPELRLGTYIAPEYREMVVDRHRRRIRGESVPTHYEFEGVRADGSRIWLEVDVVPLSDSEGKITGTQSAIRDITQRKQAELQLRESGERFRRLVDHIGDALAVDDLSGRLVFANDQFFNLFGFSREDLEGIALEDYVAPEYRTEVRDRHDRRMRGEEVADNFEYEGLRRDGTRIWIEANVVAIRNREEAIIGSQKILRDITDRRRAEQVLRESEERFRFVANTAPVMIWMCGTNNLCTYVNKPWLDFVGHTFETELGMGWTKGIHPDDLESCLRKSKEGFSRRERVETQYRLKRHDGEYRWILDTGVPRFEADGTWAGYIGSCMDITERKLAEDALATIGRRLIEAHEEERTWIGRELHDDINQRLALLAVELDRSAETIPHGAEVRELVLHAQERITQIARDVQQISHRLHSSKLDYLGLAKAANSFCIELARQANVQIHFSHNDLPRSMPKEISLCVFRILQEALQNAVKHSGVTTFTADLRRTAESIELRVADQGKGFDQEEALTRQGIGLISMRERLQLVRGELTVTSKPGSGTTIHARVPLGNELRELAS